MYVSLVFLSLFTNLRRIQALGFLLSCWKLFSEEQNKPGQSSLNSFKVFFLKVSIDYKILYRYNIKHPIIPNIVLTEIIRRTEECEVGKDYSHFIDREPNLEKAASTSLTNEIWTDPNPTFYPRGVKYKTRCVCGCGSFSTTISYSLLLSWWHEECKIGAGRTSWWTSKTAKSRCKPGPLLWCWNSSSWLRWQTPWLDWLVCRFVLGG